MVGSFVKPPYPTELVLQHVPTVAAVLGLVVLVLRLGVSNISFACLAGFLVLHIIGARWIYSFVPYDDVAVLLTGTSLSDVFGWTRNHYDRLVHFGSGLLGVPPISEWMQRHLGLPPIPSVVIAAVAVLAIGAAYEVLEWQLAVWLSPRSAEAYNGQQGDIWDPQKDMALAAIGAIISAVLFRDWVVSGKEHSSLAEAQTGMQ